MRDIHQYQSSDDVEDRATLILPPRYDRPSVLLPPVRPKFGSGTGEFKYTHTEGNKFNDALHGLQSKFLVERIVSGERDHSNCEYFVLDLTHDPNARAAAQTYARLIAWSQPLLADDLTALTLSLEPKP